MLDRKRPRCPYCLGEGKIPKAHDILLATHPLPDERQTCPGCGGTGRLKPDDWLVSDGTEGWKAAVTTIYLVLEAIGLSPEISVLKSVATNRPTASQKTPGQKDHHHPHRGSNNCSDYGAVGCVLTRINRQHTRDRCIGRIND